MELDHVKARRIIAEVRQKLRDHSATPADHLLVLEALLVLPTEEAEPLLSEFRRQFAVVVARMRERERQREKEEERARQNGEEPHE